MSELVVLPAPKGAPLSALAAALSGDRWPVLLDSGAAPSPFGRFHMLAFDPIETLALLASDAPVGDADARALGQLEAALDRWLPDRHQLSPLDRPDLPGFAGGAVAMLGYDLGRELEALPARTPRDGSLPDLLAGIYPFLLAEDVATGRRCILGRGSVTEGERFAREVEALGASACPPGRVAPARGAVRSTFDRDGYVAAVEAVREHILDGDVYQVNLSQRFRVPWSGAPAALQLALAERSPAPFGVVFRTPRGSIVSSSPELFLRRRGNQLLSRPIKGTRPRGESPREDARLAAELEQSDKEQAELAMIVDLVRNDLGRSAEVGSVRVDLPMETDAWSTVFHRVASVRATLPDRASAAAIVEAAFPPASVTGTPKLAALALIEALEPVRRHAYTGALGWFDAAGDFDLSVAIRIATHVDGHLDVPVGAGITLASEPAAEYEETLHKARGLFDVLRLDLPFEHLPT